MVLVAGSRPEVRPDEVPLHEVTFVVIDTETTGGSPLTCALTDVAAARYRGGERTGTFQTLVNPGMPVPATISALTGIRDDMVATAPPVSAVLPALLEFVGDGVVVGHNVRFDLAFLNAALVASGRPPLRNLAVDTLALARRLLRPDVPDCRLGTLARCLGLGHDPAHRALADVLATGDLLHRLIELATGYGVADLRDLLELPGLAHHPAAGRLALTAGLPRQPGVYWFEDADRRVLHLASAEDVRAHARGQFARPDTERRLGRLHRVGYGRCTGGLEAAVAEVRLAAGLGGRRRRPRERRYLAMGDDGTLRRTDRPVPSETALGPFPSPAAARAAAEAVAALADQAPGAVAVLADAVAGRRGAARRLAEVLADAVAAHPGLGPGARLLERTVGRQRAVAAVRRHRRLEVEADGERAVLVHGVVAATWAADGTPGTMLGRVGRCPVPCPTGPVRADVADELAAVAGWLTRQHRAGRLRVVAAEAGPRRPAAASAPAAVGSARCSTPSS